jgi:hypothetical protein
VVICQRVGSIRFKEFEKTINFECILLLSRLLTLVFCCTSFVSFAQFGNICVDSNRINPWYNCGPTFQPVCACDAKTYRNECLSYKAAGNNTILYSGVCQNDFFFYDFWPNLVHDQFNFYMQLAPQQTANATFTITDVFGNQVYNKLLNNLNGDFPYFETVYLVDIEPGVYFVTIQSQGIFKIRKFVKHNL